MSQFLARDSICLARYMLSPVRLSVRRVCIIENKKAVLPQGNRAMPEVFFSVEVRQQHSLKYKKD